MEGDDDEGPVQQQKAAGKEGNSSSQKQPEDPGAGPSRKCAKKVKVEAGDEDGRDDDEEEEEEDGDGNRRLENRTLLLKRWVLMPQCPFCPKRFHDLEELVEHSKKKHKKGGRNYLIRQIKEILKSFFVSLFQAATT